MKNKKKVAIFRGDFNPIHNGHINVVKEVINSDLVDEIWVIPGMKHQFDYELIDSELRVEMIEMAFKDMDNVKVCREELDFPGISYPYDTVKRLKEKFDYDFVWLAGSDLFYEVEKLYKHMDFLNIIDFIIFERKGYPVVDVKGMNVVKVLSKDINGISSSGIRLRVFERESVRRFVPYDIETFIRERNLYRKIVLP
jgi:nicotinate-nucleotide adenylyltransferase